MSFSYSTIEPKCVGGYLVEKTINVLIDFTRITENVLEQLGYEIIKEEKSDCGLYVYYTVMEKR